MSEEKRETTFENAKVGDRCYSPMFKSVNPDDKTNACIIQIKREKNYPLIVKSNVDTRLILDFEYSGNYIKGGGQVLFWENPIKLIPVRPKRKVVKTGYFVIQPCKQNDLHPGRIGLIPTELHDSPQRLEGLLGYDGRQLGSVEFEVEG